MTLEQAINYAAQHLPGNWIISLHVERGAGWVTVARPDGFDHKLQFNTEQTLADQVLSAVKYSREQLTKL